MMEAVDLYCTTSKNIHVTAKQHQRLFATHLFIAAGLREEHSTRVYSSLTRLALLATVAYSIVLALQFLCYRQRGRH